MAKEQKRIESELAELQKRQEQERKEKEAARRLLAEKHRLKVQEEKAKSYIEEVRATTHRGCLILIWLEIAVLFSLLCGFAAFAVAEGVSSELWQEIPSMVGAITLMFLLLFILKQRNKKIMIKRLDKLSKTGHISVEERRIIEESLRLRRAK